MKKLWIVLLFLLAASGASAQVNSSNLRKKVDGGITGDSTNAIAVICPRSASAPGTPLTGQCWCDTATTPCTAKIYDGSAWQASTRAEKSTGLPNRLGGAYRPVGW